MITLDKARELIAKYPDHDAFVKMKNEESIAKGDGDNSIRMSNLWAYCKDMIWQADSYNPVGCDHKKANGWSAWECYSEGHHIGSEEYSDTYLFVCLKCGDIKVSGRHRGIYFEQIVSIHWWDALKAIIKQAEFIYGHKLFEEVTR